VVDECPPARVLDEPEHERTHRFLSQVTEQ